MARSAMPRSPMPGSAMAREVSVVVPTVGRPSLAALLQVPRGRRHRHAVTTASGATALLAATAAGRHRAAAIVAAVAATAWLAATAEFAAARIRPGPGNPREIATMLVTSALIPPLATGNWLRGWWSARGARPLRSFGR